MHWEYEELFDAVNETYNEFKLENMSGTKHYLEHLANLKQQ